MDKQSTLETLFKQSGFNDYKWIDPPEIVVAQWVRIKCMFGCGEYGRNATCPPYVPSIPECKAFFADYRTAAVFHFRQAVAKPEDRHAWTRSVNRGLLKLEREVFVSGYYKAFMLFMDSCGLCAECTGDREECLQPRQARPSPESMGMDVFATVKKGGLSHPGTQ